MNSPTVTVRNRLLRGYGPFLLLVVLALGMAVFVPSRVQEVRSGGQLDGRSPTGATDGDAVGPDGGLLQSGTDGGLPSGGPSGAIQPCADRTEQVPGDPYSPVCLTFTGDNGGATHQGVTKDEIHISMRRTKDASLDDALAGIVGTEILDTPADVERTARVLVQYFNERFQLYGRRFVLDYFDGQGATADELVGNGRDKAEVDATKVADEIKPFIDLTAGTEPYADALSRRQILNVGAPLLSREWLAKRAPYAWSVLPDCSTLVESAMEFVIQRLSGPTADFAGGALKGAPRKITALAPENSWYQECVGAARDILRSRGEDFDVEPMSYKIDLTTLSNQAANLVPRMKSLGVTTILCGCDFVLPVFLSGVANREGYYPEFVSGYEQDYIGQLWDPTFQEQSFGISPFGSNSSQKPQETIGYAAYKSIASDEPANAVDGLYYTFYMLAIGVQGAGPNLTPQTYAQAMFDYPEHYGPAGLWNFGPDDFTPMDDFHEFYWDPDAVSTYNGKRGAWVDPNPGKRYRKGELPAGPPEIPR